MTNNIDIAWENIEAYLQKAIKPILPNASLKQSSLFGDPNSSIRTFSAHLKSTNLFKGTIYEHSGAGPLLHFTSLPVLSTILKTGFLRMSDFNCLSDKSEIFFAQSKFGWVNSPKQDNLEKEKSKMFCLSACESNDKVIHNSTMWKEYADNGFGCSIEYKFKSSEINNMSFGKIQYGKRKLKPLQHLCSLMKNFEDRNDGFQINNSLNFLTPLFALHKDIGFKHEQEVRLFFYQDGSIGNSKHHINHYHDFYKYGQVRNFIKIFLSGHNKSGQSIGLDEKYLVKISPEIEISRVFLGPNIQNTATVIKQLNRLKEEAMQTFEIWRVASQSRCFKLKY